MKTVFAWLFKVLFYMYIGAVLYGYCIRYIRDSDVDAPWTWGK